jgi:hypothetical protein
VVAAAVIGGAVIGAAGSMAAGSQQAGGAKAAANTNMSMFQTVQGNEQPFIQSGQQAQGQLNYLTGVGTPGQGQTAGSSGAGGYGSLLSPFTIDQFHQMSPAYQFQQQQGMQGVLSGDAAGAGALSGSAQKDLIGFNQGLANTSFNNAFNQYQTQQGNIYNRLAGIAAQGQAAGSNQTTGASTFGGNVGTAQYNVGSAYAGGIAGAANNLGNAGALPWLLRGAYSPSGYAGPTGSGNESAIWPGASTGTVDTSGFNVPQI